MYSFVIANAGDDIATGFFGGNRWMTGKEISEDRFLDVWEVRILVQRWKVEFWICKLFVLDISEIIFELKIYNIKCIQKWQILIWTFRNSILKERFAKMYYKRDSFNVKLINLDTQYTVFNWLLNKKLIPKYIFEDILLRIMKT